jgi:hypothetical protein
MAPLSFLALALFETVLSAAATNEKWITADWTRLAANETNETEIIMVLPTATPTVMPTPVPTAAPTKPTSKFTMSTEIVSATDSMPDQAILQAALESAMPGVDPTAVEIAVIFKVEQMVGIPGVTPETFTEAIAKPSFATAYGASEDTIEVEIAFNRRMDAHEMAASSSGGATVTVVITTTDATTADTVKATASDVDQVGTSFKAAYEAKAAEAGQTIVLATITPEAPNLEMDIEYNVRSSSGVAVEPPTAADFATKLTEAGGTALTFKLETPAPTSTPTSVPTGMPTKGPTPLAAGDTHSPTQMPTNMPSKMPTSAPTRSPTATPTTAATSTTTTTAAATTAAATTAAATPTPAPVPATAPTADSTTTSTAAPKTAPTESAAFSGTLSAVASVCVAMALTATTVY